MQNWSESIPGGSVRIAVTDRTDGDLAVDPETHSDRVELDRRRRSIIDRPWVWLRQVHGADVLVVRSTDDPNSVMGECADALVTDRRDIAVAVHSADCATVALWAPEGMVGVAHAGWRGVESGVIGATARSMRDLGASALRARVGPVIGVECYEFGGDDLDRLAGALGPTVVGADRLGRPALDMRAALRVVLERAGVEVVSISSECTGCRPTRYWSYRRRSERERHALVAWIDEAS